MRFIRRSCAAALAVGLLVLAPQAQAIAFGATPGTNGGISVTPAIVQLDLIKGQTDAHFSVTIANHTAAPVQVKLDFADFEALNDTGGITFIDQSPRSLKSSHDLLSWVQLDVSQVGIEPGAAASVPIELRQLGSLSPGGHYGAITYKTIGAAQGAAGNRVQVNQLVTTLVFVATAGEGTSSLRLLPPDIGALTFAIPDSINVFVVNDGNVQTVPRGSVQIDSGDLASPIAVGVLNGNSSMVLPASTRLLATPLTVLRTSWWPHRYHVRIQYRPDNAATFSTYTKTFWYVNPLILGVGGLIIALVAVAARWAAKHRQWFERRLRWRIRRRP
jgi:hypothetical protein